MSYADLARFLVLRPLDRPVECEHRSSQFKAPMAKTIKALRHELRAVDGLVDAILMIDFREQDLRLDGLPRADKRAQSPAVVLAFQAQAIAGEPHLRYEVGTYARWSDNVRAIALGLEALRAVDRYGITRRGEQYAGWKALPMATGNPSPERGRTLIREHGSVRRALHATHPDHGGSARDFADVRAAQGLA